jgi:transposase
MQGKAVCEALVEFNGMVRMTAPQTYDELVAENARLRRVVAEQKQQLEGQQRRIASLEKTVEQLRALVEELTRRGKRQAAPFSKGPPQEAPKRPGRKPGTEYGTKAHREPPAPEQITETHAVPLPDCCPHCAGHELEVTHQDVQFQVDLPQQPIYRQFTIAVGRCQNCGGRVQGQHPLQSSQALGAACSQLGPVLVAFLAVLQKQLGLAHGKCVKLLQTVWGIKVSRGGVVQALQRLAERVAPTVEQIGAAIRASPEVAVDETGWRIGGHSAWLHTLATDQAVLYAIAPTRAAQVTAAVLGWDYGGVLVHDGFRSYDNFLQARHQQCLAHVLRRCQDLLDTTPGGSVDTLAWLKGHLQEALAQRDRLEDVPRLRLTLPAWVWFHRDALLERLAGWWPRLRPLMRFRHFLKRYSGSLFTFLTHDSAATNWRAEQALRPAVVNRKVWGGNRTSAGAAVQSALMTVITTLERQQQSVMDFLTHSLCCRPNPLRLAA